MTRTNHPDALREAGRTQLKAARRGFDWPRNDPRLWQKLAEEIRELRAVQGDPRRAADELGDVLFMVVNLSRHLNVDARRALAGATRKFERRYAYVIQRVDASPPQHGTRRLEQMEILWRAAKRREKASAKSRTAVRVENRAR